MRPTLLDRLPLDGRKERSERFFHQEISIQDQLWLGGANLLGLDADTDGVLANYTIDGKATLLLLVQYTDAASASAALEALQDSQLSDLVVAATQDSLLGALFGKADEAAAKALLTAALGNR